MFRWAVYLSGVKLYILELSVSAFLVSEDSSSYPSTFCCIIKSFPFDSYHTGDCVFKNRGMGSEKEIGDLKFIKHD